MRVDVMTRTKRDKWGCGCAVVNSDNKILLGMRCKSGDLPQWCFPGGSIEVGETPVQGIIREVKEESGLEPVIVEFEGVILVNKVYDYIFTCRHFTGEVKAQETEMQDFKWFSKEELKELPLFPYTAEAVKMLETKGVI